MNGSFVIEALVILFICVMGWLVYLVAMQAVQEQGSCPPYDKDEIESLRRSKGELPRETFEQ
jgi:hypothetical protein